MDSVLIRQNTMGIWNNCCYRGCSYNLNHQNRNINPSSLENVSYQNLHLQLERTNFSQTVSHPSGPGIFNRNNQISVSETQLITSRDGI